MMQQSSQNPHFMSKYHCIITFSFKS
uniref:Uncharacterized protein n=1 Tax=Arundo donax TaxID=35708 RepID=A0A0A9C393_ARUDO